MSTTFFKMKKLCATVIMSGLSVIGMPVAHAATNDAGLMPIDIVNSNQQSVVSDSKVYIIVKAQLPDQATETDCFVQFATDGKGTCQPVSATTSSKDFAIDLNSLPAGSSANSHRIYIPEVISGRIYISVNQPVTLPVRQTTDANGKSINVIVDPDGFLPTDENYNTLYDKVEFTYHNGHNQGEATGSWVNPTAVDFFSLPIKLVQPTSTTVQQAGMTDARATIFSNLQSYFSDHASGASLDQWNKLIINFKNDDGSTTPLRIMAPNKAMPMNIDNTDPFDVTYLSNDAYSFNYIQAVINYYSHGDMQPGNNITVDCSEVAANFPIKLKDYMFTGHYDPIHQRFEFNNAAGQLEVDLPIPMKTINKDGKEVKIVDSGAFFGGAGESFDAPNNTPKAVIVRDLTAAFDVGMLPTENLPNTDGTVVLSKDFFTAAKAAGMYYQTNSLINAQGGPWFDLYSEAMHSFNQPIYTFAYDDILGQDGTLHDPNENPGLVTITLGDLSNTVMPNLADSHKYTITPVLPAGDGVKMVVDYKDPTSGDYIPLKNGTDLTGMPAPLHIRVNGQHEADLYFRNPFLTPVFPGSEGIRINVNGEMVTITFPDLEPKSN